MRGCVTTPERYVAVPILEENNSAHTRKTSPTYSEVVTSPMPRARGSGSTSASPSPATGATCRRRLHTTRKTFARSVVPAVKGVCRETAPVSNPASSPGSHTKEVRTPTSQSSPNPSTPSPARSILDFFLGSSASAHKSTQRVARTSSEHRRVELERPSTSPPDAELSLSASHSLGLFQRSPAPARAYIEDFLAITDEDINDQRSVMWSSPLMPDHHSIAVDCNSPSVRTVGVTLNNSPVVPEMWEETDSSSSTSSICGSDALEQMTGKKHSQRGTLVSRVHPGTASSNRFTSPQENAIHAPKRSAPMIEEKQRESPLADREAELPRNISTEDGSISLGKEHLLCRTRRDFDSGEAVERELHFPYYTAKEESVQMKSSSWRTAPAATDQADDSCCSRQELDLSPLTALPRSSPSSVRFLPPPSVQMEKMAPMSSGARPQESFHRSMWNGDLGGSDKTAYEGERGNTISRALGEAWKVSANVPPLLSKPCVGDQRERRKPSAYCSLNGRTASFHVEQQAPRPGLALHADTQRETIDPSHSQRCASQKSNVRALLARLYPRTNPSQHTRSISNKGSAEKQCPPQVAHRVHDAPTPRWNGSTRVYYNPLTEGIDLDHNKSGFSSVGHDNPSGTSEYLLGNPPAPHHRRRCKSAPVKVPLHTRTSLLRLEVTKAHKAAEAVLREENESPSFHPTLAPNSARICRGKLRELKSAKSEAMLSTAQGHDQGNALRAKHRSHDANASVVTCVKDISSSAAMPGQIYVSSSPKSFQGCKPKLLPSRSPVTSLDASEPPSLQTTNTYPPSTYVSTNQCVKTVEVPADRSVRRQKPMQGVTKQQLGVQTDQHRGALASFTQSSLESPGCAKSHRPPASPLTDHRDTSTQCDLLSSDNTVPSTRIATCGSEFRQHAAHSPESEADSQPHRNEQIVAQTARQRVDLYSTNPSEVLEMCDSWSERKLRVEEQLQAFHTDRQHRRTILGHTPEKREFVTNQPLFKPFMGR